MSFELKDYYNQFPASGLETSARSDNSSATRTASGMIIDKPDDTNPVTKMIDIGRQERELAAQTAQHDNLRNRAKSGISGAMDEMMEKFGKEEPAPVFIKLPESMVKDGKYIDENGQAHEQFGAKEITNDRVRQQLEKDLQKAAAYFPDVKATEIEDRDGKNFMIVTNVDIRQYNAVLRAEQETARLEERAAMLAAEREKAMTAMGLTNTKATLSGGEETKGGTFAHAPAADKSKEPQLT